MAESDDESEARWSRSKEFSESLQPIQKFPLRKIRKATNNFKRTDLIVAFDVIRGEYIGGYFDDYLIDKDCLKYYLSEVEYPVTVRRFKTSKWSVDNIENEKSILSNGLKHDNIARLLGYCQEKEEFMLIYEYSLDRNVKKKLLGREVKQRELDWTERYDLCLGIAKGLAHLHKKMEIIHQDIKTANIFLSNSSNPKIAGFSWAKRARGDLSSSRIAVTIGYSDPELFVNSGKLTEKVDVYSYGVVLLEVVRGKRCYQNDVEKLHEPMDAPGDLLKFIDQPIGEAHRDKALTLLELSVMCTKSPSEQRPEMTEVVGVLEGKINVKELNKEKLMQSDVNGDGDICTMVCNQFQHTEPDKSVSSSISLLQKMQQQMISSEEDLSHEEETLPLPDNEAFEELEILVRGNDLEKALGKEIKPKILRFCEILDGSTLPENRLHNVESAKYLLESTSRLSSNRTYYSFVVESYEKVKTLVEQLKCGKDADAPITLQITPLENFLETELGAKLTAEKMLKHVNQELQYKMKDWKHLQESFRWLHNLNLK